jgi:hypothetical protein
MTSERYWQLRNLLYVKQGGKCPVCHKPLEGPVELAHRIPRGQIVRKVGKWAEWHHRALWLVCTRRGKACNDAALLPIGVAREELLDELRKEAK